MNTVAYSMAIIKELESTLSKISPKEAEKLADSILQSKKIFAVGAGRTGFMIKAFAMRLMHMGFEAYVVGETITPNIEKGDLLLIGSGSGETGSLVTMAHKVKKIEANLALVTIFPLSSIGQMADIVIKVPAPTPKVEVETGFKSIQPMGSLFEQSLLLLLDAVILQLMDKRGKDSNTMFTRHANLE
ncbi:MAG TPA: 6-phospho-3-hexuloisomerase [Firmicutes bacterium]|jgi:6-phospho-3-hexuloisomerase|nr:6-phospho-3-hexuloisomerase [Bacillota bacterium]